MISRGEVMVEFYSKDNVSLEQAKSFEKSLGGDTASQ